MSITVMQQKSTIKGGGFLLSFVKYWIKEICFLNVQKLKE